MAFKTQPTSPEVQCWRLKAAVYNWNQYKDISNTHKLSLVLLSIHSMLLLFSIHTKSAGAVNTTPKPSSWHCGLEAKKASVYVVNNCVFIPCGLCKLKKSFYSIWNYAAYSRKENVHSPQRWPGLYNLICGNKLGIPRRYTLLLSVFQAAYLKLLKVGFS